MITNFVVSSVFTSATESFKKCFKEVTFLKASSRAKDVTCGKPSKIIKGRFNEDFRFIFIKKLDLSNIGKNDVVWVDNLKLDEIGVLAKNNMNYVLCGWEKRRNVFTLKITNGGFKHENGKVDLYSFLKKLKEDDSDSEDEDSSESESESESDSSSDSVSDVFEEDENWREVNLDFDGSEEEDPKRSVKITPKKYAKPPAKKVAPKKIESDSDFEEESNTSDLCEPKKFIIEAKGCKHHVEGIKSILVAKNKLLEIQKAINDAKLLEEENNKYTSRLAMDLGQFLNSYATHLNCEFGNIMLSSELSMK